MPTNYLSQHLSGFRGGWFTSSGAEKARKKQIVTSQQSPQKITKHNQKSFSIVSQNQLKILKLYFLSFRKTVKHQYISAFFRAPEF